MTTEAPYGEAGRWYAVCTDRSGFVAETVDELLHDNDCELGECVIAVVKDTAAPVRWWPAEYRLPGSYSADDMVHEFTEFESSEDFEAKWLDAVAIAESRNTRRVTR